MYGTQAAELITYSGILFENDVKMYGTQAWNVREGVSMMFENDVKMYGTQAVIWRSITIDGVWEWCKNVWYSSKEAAVIYQRIVWEWCKNVWYSSCY